jgi:hypothetical protein
MLAAWFVTTDSDDSEIQSITRRAACCAQSILQNVHGHAVYDSIQVKLKVIVSTGSLSMLPLSGLLVQQKGFIVDGRPLSDMKTLKHAMKPGKIVFNSSSRVALRTEVKRLSGTVRCGMMVMEVMNCREAGDTLELPTQADGFVGLSFIPKHKTITIEKCTVAFIAFSCAQEMMQLLHMVDNVLRAHAGTLLQTVIDENGPSCLCAFGLSGSARRGTINGAVRAMRTIVRATFLSKLIAPACGIATGTVNAGPVFCVTRADSAARSLIGLPVIIAARLAEATHSGNLAMDLTTRVGAGSALAGLALSNSNIPLKGFSKDVQVFIATES